MSIETILAMLARATSDSDAEAIKAIDSTYKRMQKEGVSIFDLLDRPKEDLYQNSLNRLADLISKVEYPNEPSKQRETYAKLTYLIMQKFIPEEAKAHSTGQGSSGSDRADAAQKAYEEAQRKKSQDNRSNSAKSSQEEEATDKPEPSSEQMPAHAIWDRLKNNPIGWMIMLNHHYVRRQLWHDLAHDLKNTLLLFTSGIALGFVLQFFVVVVLAVLGLNATAIKVISFIALYVGATSSLNFALWKHRGFSWFDRS